MRTPPHRNGWPRAPAVVALACALALLAGAAAAPPATRVDPPVEFRLRDQFGRTHDAADYRGRPMLLVAAGRGGRAAGTAWGGMLRGLQPDSATGVPVVAVADLRGVPRLLRRVVRGRFPEDRRQAVLLDWDGALARRLALDPERCTLLLVAPDGGVEWRTSPAAVDTAAARALLARAADLAPAGAAGSHR
ncbi:hypothetical protein [Roseisolibacter sp. H3M3-2]|uniref:hypothetical protein n=1 Tax=Roseisolibacter sp. H3M3-2 TaxID=3031323 RepID=UPI0023DB416E|nr:hypothetical protein [Roseisolibacter sp. H3M3-2]MDF1504871.1 hypothetical protein [Roseisolibacter sp. H3M3-2]